MAKPPEQVSGDRRRRRPVWLDLRRTGRGLQAMLYGGLASLISLIITFWTLPQISSDGRLPILRLVVLLAVFGLLMRWFLAGIAILIGSVGVLVGGLLSQFGVVYLGITVDPGVNLHGVEAPLLVSIVMSSVSAVVGWIAYAGSDDAYVAEVMRVVHRRARKIKPAPKTGMLIIQIDGLSEPLLNWMVLAGNLPNLGGWIRDGKHSMVGWHTGVPSTTPASQAGILHGGSRQIPAFRWYEKETARVMVTNRGRDAAEIEDRMSTGRGLLADGGVSISNNWSGDAQRSELVFSRASLPSNRSRGYVRFFSSPQGAARGLVLCVAEMVKELHQARRQRVRHLVPRVKRGGGYIFLRAISNVLLRDLNVSLITDELVKGTPVIYCDFVDYDEVAHHAGPTRAESLQTLEGLDRVLGALHRIIDILPHSYEIVVLSDHGQSQGSTFLQRYGRTLTEVVDDLVDTAKEPVAAVGKTEGWGPVNAFLTELSLRRSVAGSVTRKALHARVLHGEVELGPKDCEPEVAADEQMVVTSSGNLALIYLATTPGRVPLEEIELLHPKLIPGLATHPGIGFVVVDSLAEGPVAIGRAGVHVLKTGRIEGEDPLTPYGPFAAASMLRQAEMPHNGDVVVISRLDDYTHEVAAFEELVGCHGGIGGWQTEAVLVHPSRWVVKEPPVGSDAVHALLIGWLEQLGHRKELREPAESPTSVEA
ncbi:type I phosphodiesterase/nucleotide pyrophosphatase [Kribbella antiqua]|uniref:Type I phosphodiesterase/nucleotide pyrophosphatase n=1 Tax=Kribbella antiqua TaxID=2512217 RepID=A0A4R2J6I6_9ACTN|nr:alkaline phosphatase family protein [Kribbella antiqua]TCO51729.1 type I phosphodiesterase/nucleotide pyrophosphatase [Kribbella antiqua]